MDPTLYYKIYGEGVDKEIIPRHIKYVKFCYFYNLAKDYIWRDGPKVES